MQKTLTKLSKVLLAICVFVFGSVFLCACAEKIDLPYSIMERDVAKIGGENLTYSYDAHEHILTVGGDGEEIAYYTANDAIGRTMAGNYIGVKITAPDRVKDFQDAEIEYNGKVTTNGEFMVDKRYTVLRLKVTERERDFEIKIKWQKDANVQTYKVHIAESTKLEKLK